MRRHNVFTFGIILTTIYSINAMAALPTKPAENIWTNSGHTTLATEQCSDCCKADCWLPDGTYYDAAGTFTESCGLVSYKSPCPSGQYDIIGFSSCISVHTSGTAYAFWEFDGKQSNVSTYGLTGSGQWGVAFDYGITKGIASCNSTSGTHGVATDQEFSNTANGKSCWCKMTEPAASRWVFDYAYSLASDCTSDCAVRCAINVQNYADMRSGVFRSITSTTSTELYEPTCDSNRTYSMVNGVCKKDKLSCPSGQYDMGFSSCISGSTKGTARGYWNFDGSTSNTATYELNGPGQWGVKFDYGIVTGIASCNSTSGGVVGDVTNTEFSNTANGEYCWCKMTYPATSRWVFHSYRALESACTSVCANVCSQGVQNTADMRSGLFGSVE